jgi:outer membrane protein assembly factor BamB/predicted MPP superfamily phosphohydrolase
MKLLTRMFCFFIFLFITPTSYGQTQQFRFAWLSDTHVGSATGATDLGNSIRDINTMNDIAFVILSGDITEMGFDAQLDLAKAILDNLRKPYYIIPGNHDTKWSPSGCTKFSSLWGKDKFIFEYSGYRFIGMHEGPIMKMGDGHFAPEDRYWLDSVLTSLPNKRQALFFVTHYPLDPGIDNWYEAIERLKRFNTQAVLVGHEHNNRVANFEGIPGVVARSNLRAAKTSTAYTIVDIDADTVSFSECMIGYPSQSQWHKLALGQRNFSRDTTTYSRPDFSINKKYSGVKNLWTVKSGSTIASTPAVWKDYVVIGDSRGTVCCYSLKSGSRRWTFKTGATVYSSAGAADGKVVFGSSDRHVYCLDIATGKLAWKIATGAPVIAAATINEGIVYIGGSDGIFRTIELQSGKVKWEYNGVGGFVETRPLLYAGKVIFGAWDTYLYALSSNDGSLVWEWTNGNPGDLYSPAACWPVAANGKVFIVAPDRWMTAINAETGTTVWRSKRYQVRECVGLSQDSQRVYVKCMTDTVVAFSTTDSSPTTLWATSCGYGYDIDPSMPVEKDGAVFLGTKNGLIIALDGKTGSVLWKHRVGETIVHTLVPLDAHHVIASDLDGRLMLLKSK